VESMAAKLDPLISKLGIAGSTLLFSFFAVVISLTLTVTVIALSEVRGLPILWVTMAIIIPLLLVPPVAYMLLKLIDSLNHSYKSLQVTQGKVKELSALVPVCSCCRKIRDDEAYWDRLEEYISNHAHGEMAHGTCPNCKDKNYADFLQEEGES